MNPQYLPPQFSGAPGANAPQPNFPGQGFQNVPLDSSKPLHSNNFNSGPPGPGIPPQKSMASQNNSGITGHFPPNPTVYPQSGIGPPPNNMRPYGTVGPSVTNPTLPPSSVMPPMSSGPPPSNTNFPQPPPGQFPPSLPKIGSPAPANMQPIPPSHLPPTQSQIPPEQRPPSRPQGNPFNTPLGTKQGENAPDKIQNGPPSQFHNGLNHQTSEGSDFGPTPVPGAPAGVPLNVLPPQFPNKSGFAQNVPPGHPGQFPPASQPSGQPQPAPVGMPPRPTPNQFGQPLLPAGPPGQPSLPTGASMPGGPPSSLPPRGGQQNFMAMPGQPMQPPLQDQGFPGQPPRNQFNQPPLPGQMPPSQYPPVGGPPTQFGNPNQLANQMQGMNLSGPRQYPGGPMNNAMNGDSGPHMPPPLNQPNYQQQQMRSPQSAPVPGYPPMPGPGQAPSGPYPQSGYQAPQQKRLDPDQMPSPIQVMQDDQQNRSKVFVTNQKGLVPPLVTTNVVVQDQGNASPRFIRSTMYNVPITQDILKQTAVPFSLVISPMAKTVENEYPPPIVNFGDLGPVRCIRCKAYMCPYMQFIDSGRRFQCLFCKATTDVPTEYFQHLDHTGQRIDKYERPELVLGTYEFVATADYCRNNTLPKPPAMIFIIDVSYNNVKSGLVNLLCSQIKEIIQHLPIDQGQEKSNMRVGFITYNSSVHFYNIKGTLAAPQMMVVGDTQEMFMPLLDGFLCTPEESGPVIDALMEQIPTMFGETRETETVLLPAILAGLEALKASECVGKLLVFHSSLPTAEAPGKLKNREDRKLLGTDKERTVLTPQSQAYNQLGQECVAAGCCVDLFIFNNSYIDIATIGQVSRLTGGEVFKYTYFQADIDGDRLIQDIIMDINRPIAFDAVMRVRTSTGIRPTDFFGHFYMSNTTDMELAAIDCAKAVTVEIKHDDKLSEEEGVYIQVALLYTSCSGQRRLRILNLSLKTCSQMADLYRSCDLDAIINYISKQSVYKLLDHNPKAVKDAIVTRAAQILATYRKNCASPSSAGQLILPECMKLLPLYVSCLLKSDALSGGSDMTIDDRSFVMQAVMTMNVETSVHHFYPRLLPLHDLEPSKESFEIPMPIRSSIEKISEQGVYILENGIHMFLWVGLGVSPDFVQNVFGVPSAIQIDIERVNLPQLDNPLSVAVRGIIDEIRIQRHRCMRLTIVRQKEKLEPIFKHFLVEDRGTDGSASYVDFLCHMHKEIRALLS